jgi:hypothetical protein
MSKHHLRKDKACQNCGTLVAERYCSHCGQENTETRQSFGHLVRHFFEDLTHYDGGFWKTMKYLLFRPAFLTREYLAGKRAAHVPPVRLYIFISFACFFLPAILPKIQTYEKEIHQAREEKYRNRIEITEDGNAPFKTDYIWSGASTNKSGVMRISKPNDYHSVEQMDSMQRLLPEAERYNKVQRWMAQRTIDVYHHYTPEQVAQKFGESFLHNLPKALFVYMPLFALALWIMQSKKKWMFFDHAIFTLHYFSFILLTWCLYSILRCLCRVMPYHIYESIVDFVIMVMGLSWLVYFFLAHHRLYREKRIVSFLKSSVLFFVNCIFILFLLIGFAYYTLFTLH